jgi:hypothetical protein
VFILKQLKVLCFHTLLQVFILKVFMAFPLCSTIFVRHLRPGAAKQRLSKDGCCVTAPHGFLACGRFAAEPLDVAGTNLSRR